MLRWPPCHLHANYTKVSPGDMLEKDTLLRRAAPWRTEEGWGCPQLPRASQLDAPVQWTHCSTGHTSPGGAQKLGGICFKPNPNFPRNMLEGRSWQHTTCRLPSWAKIIRSQRLRDCDANLTSDALTSQYSSSVTGINAQSQLVRE